MDWLKKAPTAVVITVIIVFGMLALGALAVFTVLTLNGEDTTEFRSWLNTVANLVVLPGVGLAAVAATSAARSASNTEEQTNGTLTARDDNIAALSAQLREVERRLAAAEQTNRNLRGL